MKRFIALLTALLVVYSPSYAAGPLIWSGGGQARGLNPGGITLNDYSTLSDTGPVNEIKNGGFEDPYVADWVTYADAAGVAPVDGTGGTATNISALTQDTTAANLISGQGVAQLVKSAANAQGQGWSRDFKLKARSARNNAQVSLKFDYYMSTAAVTDVLRVYLYDKDLGVLITPQFTSCGGGSSPSLTATVTTCPTELVWTASSSDDYRLIFHTASTSTTAVTTTIDNIFIGEGRTVVGGGAGPITAWSPGFSPGFGATSLQSFSYMRNGEKMEISGKFKVGTPTSGVPYFTLPTGLNINTAWTTSQQSRLGTYNRIDGTNNVNTIGITAANSRQGVLGYGPTGGTNTLTLFIGTTGSQLLDEAGSTASVVATGDVVTLQASVPIAEWAGGASYGENKTEWGCDDGTNDVFGPNGCLVPNDAFGTGTTGRSFTYLGSNQPGDLFIPEINYRGFGWSEASGLWPYMSGANGVVNNHYGVKGQWTSATVYTVAFGTQGTEISQSGASNGVTSWATEFAAGTRFRVRKASGALVIYGAATSTAAGLVSSESYVSKSITFTGAASTSVAATFNKVSKQVTMCLAALSFTTCTAASSFAATTGSIPSGMEPAQTTEQPVVIIRLSAVPVASPLGEVQLNANGSINIYRDSASTNFTATVCGWYSFCTTWMTP